MQYNVSSLSEFASIAWMHYQKKYERKEAMKQCINLAISKNIVVFGLHILESFALFYGYFCMDLYNVDSDEAMKRGDEALNASSLQFLSSVKFFIATIFSQH